VEVVSEMIDEGSFSLEQCPIELTWDFINSRIGENLDQQLIIKNLENLGFTVKSTKKAIEVKIPTWRATKDVSIKEDIIEEITRIYGYDNLKPAMPTVAIEYREDNELRKLERKVKDILTQSCSANEVYCHSFVEESWLDKLGKNVNHVELSNPWSEGLGLMRQSLVPNLLQKAKENLRYFETINFFEVGKVFLKDQPGESIRFDSKDFLPAQPLMAVGIISQSDEENPYYIAKGIIEAIAERLQLKLEFFQTPDLAVWCHPKQSLEILIGKKVIGYFSTLHPKVNELMDCKNKIAIWQLNLSELLEVLPEVKKYQPLAKYPSVYLDLSIIVNEKVEWREIKSLVLSINTQIIKSVDLLDVFKNGKIESGKKSITFRTTYQSDERTLEMNEVEKIQKNIIEQLAKAVDAQVRK